MENPATVECPVRYWSARAPERLALIFKGRSWSYADLEREVMRWASIASGLSVAPKARVAVVCSNRPELIALHHALARLQATVVPLDPRLKPTEMAAALERVEPSVVIAEDALRDRVPGALSLEAVAENGNTVAVDEASLEQAATRAILLTSGTTGRPKAAELTVGNFIASAKASAFNLGGDPEQRWLACLPLFHVGGLAMLTRCAIYGASLVLHERFDEEEVNRALDRDGVTHVSLVETMVVRLLQARKDRPYSSHLKAALVGGGPATPELVNRARRQGMPVLLTYGLTEATSQVATERLEEADGRTVGVPLRGIEVRIVRGSTDVTQKGEVGEIQVRGPTVMRGYLKDEAATADSLVDGWLRTRDLGSFDERERLRVWARRLDVILRGGENVYPAEIEAVLSSHPLVAEAVVLPQHHPKWGQVPVALVIWRGARFESEDLDRWCRERLAAFKAPHWFVVVDELPKNALGKIDRAAAASLLALPAFKLP